MAALTTIQDGDWSVAGTWDSGVPGAGDTVTINHSVVVSSDVSIGTQPAITEWSVLVNDSGHVTIEDNVVFNLRGSWRGRSNSLTVGAGVVFTLATGTAGTELYQLLIGVYGDTTAGIVVTGTSSNRTVFQVTGSGLGFIDAGNANSSGGATVGLNSFTYCDFNGLGDAAQEALKYGSNFVLDHCRFDGCGQVYSGDRTMAVGDVFRISYCNFKNSAHATYSFFGRNRTTPGVTDEWGIDHCSFDKGVGWTDAVGIDHTDSFFAETPYHGASTYGVNGVWERNFVYHTSYFTCRCASIKDNYSMWDISNMHPFIPSVSPVQDQTWDGCIFENRGTDLINESDAITTTSAAASRIDYELKNTIILPDDSGYGSCTLITCGGWANTYWTIHQNTAMCGNNSGVTNNEPFISALQVGFAGQWITFKNNLLWAETSQAAASYACQDDSGSRTPATDYVTEWDWNAWYNLNPVDRFSNVVSAALPANPDANAINEDPAFVDKTRNLANFAGTVLGETGTDAQKKTAALAAFAALNDPDAPDYNSALLGVSQLVNWVKEGFAPTNPNYATASDTGSYVGAVLPVISSVSLLEGKVFIGGVGENGVEDLYVSDVYIGGVKS